MPKELLRRCSNIPERGQHLKAERKMPAWKSIPYPIFQLKHVASAEPLSLILLLSFPYVSVVSMDFGQNVKIAAAKAGKKEEEKRRSAGFVRLVKMSPYSVKPFARHVRRRMPNGGEPKNKNEEKRVYAFNAKPQRVGALIAGNASILKDWHGNTEKGKETGYAYIAGNHRHAQAKSHASFVKTKCSSVSKSEQKGVSSVAFVLDAALSLL